MALFYQKNQENHRRSNVVAVKPVGKSLLCRKPERKRVRRWEGWVFFFLFLSSEYISSSFLFAHSSRDFLHLLDHLILIHFSQLSNFPLSSNYQTFWAIFILGQVSITSTPVPKFFKQVVSRRLILLSFFLEKAKQLFTCNLFQATF